MIRNCSAIFILKIPDKYMHRLYMNRSLTEFDNPYRAAGGKGYSVFQGVPAVRSREYSQHVSGECSQIVSRWWSWRPATKFQGLSPEKNIKFQVCLQPIPRVACGRLASSRRFGYHFYSINKDADWLFTAFPWHHVFFHSCKCEGICNDKDVLMAYIC